MKKKMIFSFVVVCLLLFTASFPKLAGVQKIPVQHLAEYPELLQSYHQLCDERDDYAIQTEEYLLVATVKNLWGSWDRYILPCYAVMLPDVPTGSSVSAIAEMHILSEWSEENFFTDLCRLKVRNFSMRVEPGDNTVLYEQAEFTDPGMSPVMYLVHAGLFSIDYAITCDALPTTYVNYKLSTNLRTQEASQPVTTTIYYGYSLRMLGKRFFDGDYTFAVAHSVNA